MRLAPLGRFPPLLGLLSAVAGGNPGSSWALGSARPRAVCGREADGDPASAPAAAVARHVRLRGPRLRRDGGETCLCAAGPAEPVEPELPGSSPAAAPHPGQPVCPPACREGGREKREPRASAASWRSVPGPASPVRGVPGLPRGSGAVLAARKLPLVVGVGW